MLKFYYKTVVRELKDTVFPSHMFRLQPLSYLKQKMDINEKELLYGNFWVAAKIVGIKSSWDWFYVSCKSHGCNKKLTLRNTMYDYDKCKRTWQDGILRYKVKIRVVDLDGNAPFILWDKECTELLGIFATDLRKKILEGPLRVPREIESLVGIAMLFRIAARNEQFDNLHNAFAVMKVINDPKLVSIYCPELLDKPDKDLTSEVHSLDYEFSEEEFSVDTNNVYGSIGYKIVFQISKEIVPINVVIYNENK
ncbi:PREDICTED: uncharacterized protein LOC109158412 [Ipomoea nil]|uniref:uncharacterized protein LOC109158412 n=1 Tax=Ipomoea nil TaxID=35883 RepID=UPI000900B480|nr:PREDICTED: uncharacterized protein LOC109158412 [Ipomoea nil]